MNDVKASADRSSVPASASYIRHNVDSRMSSANVDRDLDDSVADDVALLHVDRIVVDSL